MKKYKSLIIYFIIIMVLYIVGTKPTNILSTLPYAIIGSAILAALLHYIIVPFFKRNKTNK